MASYQITKARPDEPEVEQPPDSAAGITPKVQFRWLLCGPSRSGKTNLARFCLDNYYKDPKGNKKKSFFDRVILLSPTAKLDWTWADLPGLNPKDRITNPSPKFLKDLLHKQRKIIAGNGDASAKNMKSMARRRKTAPKVLVIMDDAIAESKLINSPEFLKLFIEGRHYNISTMLMSQSYMKIPRSSRLQATHLSLFPSRKSEVDRVFKELAPKELNRKEFEDMVGYATEASPAAPFPFLHVDVFAPVAERFRRNLTESLAIGGSGQPDVEEKSGDGEDGESLGDEVEPPTQGTKRNRGPEPLQQPRKKSRVGRGR